jgi:hypothetical protein
MIGELPDGVAIGVGISNGQKPTLDCERLSRCARSAPKKTHTPFATSVDPTDARCAKARLTPSVRLATPVQTEDKPAASDEL